MTNKRIVVAIVTYNSRAHIGPCLAALRGLGEEDQIVLVDNHSIDGTVEYVQQKFPHIVVIENKKNYFLSYALNQVIRFVRADAYLVLNPDVVIRPDTIEKMYRLLCVSDPVGIVAPTLVSADGTLQSSARQFPTASSLFARFLRLHVGGPMTVVERAYLLTTHSSTEVVAVDWVIGACMLIKRQVFDRVGLYRSRRYPLYYNDTDLCWRAAQAGFCIQYAQNLRATHEYQQHSVYGGFFTITKLLHIIGATLFLCRRFI